MGRKQRKLRRMPAAGSQSQQKRAASGLHWPLVFVLTCSAFVGSYSEIQLSKKIDGYPLERP